MSRKVRCFIAISLDGFIADAQGEVHWLFTDEDYGYTDFISGIDTLLIGRKTYEQVLGFGEWPYKNLRSYVFTSQQFAPSSDVVFVHDDAVPFIRELKSQAGNDLWLVGGGALNATCLRAGLLDELIISLHPVLLGTGIPLFQPPFDLQNLTLHATHHYESGLVQLTYTVNGPSEQKHENTKIVVAPQHSADATPLPQLEFPAVSQIDQKLQGNQTYSHQVPSSTEDSSVIDPPRRPIQRPVSQNSKPHRLSQNATQHSVDSNTRFWLVALVLGIVMGIGQAFFSRAVDIPFLVSMSFGLGIGCVLGYLARKIWRMTIRTLVLSAFLAGICATGANQIGSAMLARPAIAKHLAGVIDRRSSKQRAYASSIEARLTAGPALLIYSQIQSDADWRVHYYGFGTRGKLSGTAYWFVMSLDILLLWGACAGGAIWLGASAQEQQKVREEARKWGQRVKLTLFGLSSRTKEPT